MSTSQHADITKMLFDQYLQKLDWQVKENSNMVYSLQGLNNYLASQLTQEYWLNHVYPAKIAESHRKGQLHLHDLNLLAVYCVGWDLYDLLLTGFTGVPGKTESKPAKHFRTALGQVVNFFYTLQGEAAGAQAFSSFDTLLAPFVRADGLNYAEVKQAMQECIFNLNIPTRVGFQTPFTNLTFDVTVPSTYRGQAVIIGGEAQTTTYDEYQREMDMINQAFMEVMAEGDANGRVFTFPIPTYNITKDFNWDNPNIAALWSSTARYGIPYFSNFINSDLDPEDARSMCCRLRLDTTQLEKRGGGLFGANPLTGSIGVVTINLPRLGYTSKTKKTFWKELDKLLILAKDSLEIRRVLLEKLTDQNLYPYTKYYLRHIKERTGTFWANHFSTIGVIGMQELCLNLLGEGIETPPGKQFAVEVLEHVREKLSAFRAETGHNYNLEATPAEGTTYRLASLDAAEFPNIITASTSDATQPAKPFYTNSTHLPVNHTDDLFEVLDHQDELQTLYTGGTVVHLFAGERIDDPESVKALVKKICSTYRLPYFTLTPTFSICHQHGYVVGEHPHCPDCHQKCEVYSRVVGYLRPVEQWNDGKQQEFAMRQVYKLPVHV
jgi:ribonucleoside-triphosphate reductase (formate)